MRYVTLLCILIVSFVIAGCKKDESKPTDEMQGTKSHKVTALEVTDVSNYTYVRVKENDQEFWIAVPKQKVQIGTTYYFTNTMEWKNFKSPELNKTFDKIILVDDLSTSPKNSTAANEKQPQHPELNKEDVKIEKAANGITIADLYGKAKSYEGKKIIIRGKVTKVNNAIMRKNWVHIQDGTDSNGQYDLTFTTNEELTVGSVVTVEGTISLNKDFGYGYFYKVIMEDASVKK
ncbi:MAG: GW dipeptide domain-containing protein [Ignavibacteria bacterium]|nr:GW dipeptide domain-containing protein [Ignavibacteria bacterium]